MTDETVLETTLRYTVDQASLEQARRSTREVSNSLNGINRALRDVDGKGFAEAARETDKLRESLVKATQAQQALAAQEAPSIGERAGRASTGLSQLGSGVGAITGSSALNNLGDVVGAIESLDTLRESVAGLGQVTPAAAAGLGAAAIAVGALVAVVAAYNAAAEDQRKQIAATLNAVREYNQQLATGELTSGEAERELATLSAQREREAQQVQRLEQIYNENLNTLGLLVPLLKLADNREEEIITQINQYKDSLTDLNARIEVLNGVLQSGVTSASDYARELEASIGAQRSVIDAIVGGATSDQARDTLRTLEDRVALEQELLRQLEAQLAAADPTSAAYQVLIQQINDSEAALTSTSASISAYSAALRENRFAASDAKAAEEQRQREQQQQERDAQQRQEARLRERTRRREQADRELESLTEKREQLEERYKDTIKNANNTFTQALEDARRKFSQNRTDLSTSLTRDLKKLGREFGQTLTDLARDSQRAEIDAKRNTARALEDINEQAAEDEEDAASSRNFLRIADIRKAQRRALAEEAKNAQRAQEDRNTDQDRALDDARIAADRQRDERLIQYDQQRQDAALAFEREREQAAIARQRTLAQARVAFNQESADYATHYNTLLTLRRSFLAAERALMQSSPRRLPTPRSGGTDPRAGGRSNADRAPGRARSGSRGGVGRQLERIGF